VCLVCFLLAKAEAQNVSDLLQQGTSVRRAVIPLYTAGSFNLSAVVRVDRAYIDYQRKGFFRIGLFPVGILDGVTIEARNTSSPGSSLACIRRWLETKAGQRIEMRRVTFQLSPTNRLEAGLARCVAEDNWELLKGVRFVSATREVRASRAILEMAGPRGGQVILDTVPRSTNTFLTSALTLNNISPLSSTDPHPIR